MTWLQRNKLQGWSVCLAQCNPNHMARYPEHWTLTDGACGQQSLSGKIGTGCSNFAKQMKHVERKTCAAAVSAGRNVVSSKSRRSCKIQPISGLLYKTDKLLKETQWHFRACHLCQRTWESDLLKTPTVRLTATLPPIRLQPSHCGRLASHFCSYLLQCSILCCSSPAQPRQTHDVMPGGDQHSLSVLRVIT